MSSLFRQEMLDAKRVDWLGETRIPQLRSTRLATYTVVSLVVVLIGFLCVARYTRSEHAVGLLLPAGGLIQVTSTSAGILTEIGVAQGDVVQTAHSLGKLSTELSTAYGSTATAVRDQLRVERDKILADLSDLDVLDAQKRAASLAKKKLLTAQGAQIDQQLAIQNLLLQNAKIARKKLDPLISKGYVSGTQVEEQESAILNSESQLRTLTRQKLEIAAQLSAEADQLRQQPMTTAAQRRDLERKVSEIDRALAENETRKEIVLQSPVNGRVSAVFAKVGQSLDAGQSVLAIVPDGSPLVAQLFVNSKEAGFVSAGTPVLLRYQAYSYQKFGLQKGSVTSVSESALSPAQVSSLLGQQVQEPMYRIEVALQRQTLSVDGRDRTLRPGMAVEAELQLDSRSWINWLFGPLFP